VGAGWAASRTDLCVGLRCSRELCWAASRRVHTAARRFLVRCHLPKTGFLSRFRASGRSIVGNRPVIAMLGIHIQCLLVSYRPLATRLAGALLGPRSTHAGGEETLAL